MTDTPNPFTTIDDPSWDQDGATHNAKIKLRHNDSDRHFEADLMASYDAGCDKWNVGIFDCMEVSDDDDEIITMSCEVNTDNSLEGDTLAEATENSVDALRGFIIDNMLEADAQGFRLDENVRKCSEELEETLNGSTENGTREQILFEILPDHFNGYDSYSDDTKIAISKAINKATQ